MTLISAHQFSKSKGALGAFWSLHINADATSDSPFTKLCPARYDQLAGLGGNCTDSPSETRKRIDVLINNAVAGQGHQPTEPSTWATG